MNLRLEKLSCFLSWYINLSDLSLWFWQGEVLLLTGAVGVESSSGVIPLLRLGVRAILCRGKGDLGPPPEKTLLIFLFSVSSL